MQRTHGPLNSLLLPPPAPPSLLPFSFFEPFASALPFVSTAIVVDIAVDAADDVFAAIDRPNSSTPFPATCLEMTGMVAVAVANDGCCSVAAAARAATAADRVRPRENNEGILYGEQDRMKRCCTFAAFISMTDRASPFQ